MAENETSVLDEQQEEQYAYPVRIEDAGPAKKVSVDVPHDRIVSELDKQYKELRGQAAIPGFRVGHAPQKLIEKRFAADVKEQVRRSLISESYSQAVEKNSLQVIGEPDFENPETIKLPDGDGAMSYSFTVEVQPEFTLPDLAGLKIRKPKIEIKDENVDQAMMNLREGQGALVPVEDRGLETGDFLTADVHAKVDGTVVAHRHDSELVVRPGRVLGIQIDDLDKQLAGLKPGEKRSFTVHAPDTHPSEEIRGKDVEIEVALKDFKKLELAEVNEAFLQDLGFENETELRAALREQMVEKITQDVQQALREQVTKHLLETTPIELPAKLSEKQANRVVQRRAIDLMQRGLPQDQIAANIDALRAGAQDEAGRELKSFFLLQKLAEQQGVDVDEAELNGRIAMIAAQQGQRPEKVKQTMTKDGSLSTLYVQMREQKAIDKVLEGASIEEVSVEEFQKSQQPDAPKA